MLIHTGHCTVECSAM